jgi:aspartyl-tRNA(Asn)/glutamyl-tRNA(Gln) amidotransferase subunit A
VTIQEAGAALRGRKVSSAELTEDSLRRIQQLNPKLNAFLTVTADLARAQAHERDEELARGFDRGPLHGIPIAHKDLIDVVGVLTTAGSPLFGHSPAQADAAVTDKLNDAGAVMVGKTGLHELAYGITSDNPHYGSIRNPWDTECIPGGSSGGSGAAVATEMVFMATGTDTGGSIRIPAAFCGTAGLKPTYGAVSRRGVRPLGLSLDHIGPLAKTARDCGIVFEIMAGYDPRDGSSSRQALAAEPPSVAGLRIGWPENYYLDGVDPGVREAVHGMARKAEELGARVVPIHVPDIEALNAVGRVVLLAEASAVMANLHSQREKIGPDVLALLDQGRLITAVEYVNAQRVRKQLVAAFHALFREIDALFTPTTPIPAPRIGQKEVQIDGQMYDTRLAATRLVRGINVLGFPALSIPCGLSGKLPVSLQIVGRPFEDRLLIKLGAALEDAVGGSMMNRGPEL